MFFYQINSTARIVKYFCRLASIFIPFFRERTKDERTQYEVYQTLLILFFLIFFSQVLALAIHIIGTQVNYTVDKQTTDKSPTHRIRVRNRIQQHNRIHENINFLGVFSLQTLKRFDFSQQTQIN